MTVEEDICAIVECIDNIVQDIEEVPLSISVIANIEEDRPSQLTLLMVLVNPSNSFVFACYCQSI